jgi:lysophospholipase L1-like esterase
MKTKTIKGCAVALTAVNMAAGVSAAEPAKGADVKNPSTTLTVAQQNQLQVINNGRCGQNSGIVRDKFAADVLKFSPKPDYVLIYIGMNDVINDNFFTPLDKYLENMAWMIDAARQVGITPVICTMHKVNETVVYAHHAREKFGAETVNGKRERYNVALRRLVRDQKVALADFDAVTESIAEPEFMSDGVHLTLAGNKLLAKTFLDAIGPRLKGKETIVCVGDSLTYGYLNQGAGTSEGETYPAMLRTIPLGK